MMDLDSAIQHCEEVAISKTKQVENGDWEKGSSTERDCIACAEEHQQLAEWLKELKAYREFKGGQRMTIGEEVLIHGYIDEIRKDIVIIRNEGGYFGTVPEEIRSSSEIPNTCGDAVSRQAVMDCLKKWQPYMATRLFDFEKELSELPPVSPQQRTGRWIPVGYDGYADGNPVYDWWECSECGWEHTGDEESLTAFCPKCGCKMEVEDADIKCENCKHYGEDLHGANCRFCQDMKFWEVKENG